MPRRASRGWDGYTRRTKWGPRDTHRAFQLAGGTRTLILHGSNDPLLSVVRADIGGVKVFPGRGRGRSFVKRLSNDYIHVCVAHEREKGKEGAVGDGRALPSMPVCMVRTRRMSMSVPAYYFECTTSLCPLCRVRQAAKSSGRRRRNSPRRGPFTYYVRKTSWDFVRPF